MNLVKLRGTQRSDNSGNRLYRLICAHYPALLRDGARRGNKTAKCRLEKAAAERIYRNRLEGKKHGGKKGQSGIKAKGYCGNDKSPKYDFDNAENGNQFPGKVSLRHHIAQPQG